MRVPPPPPPCYRSAQVYKYLEVALIPARGPGGQYPALYLYSTDARLMRPVLNLSCQRVEYIGTLEQVYLNVAVRLKEVPQEVSLRKGDVFVIV